MTAATSTPSKRDIRTIEWRDGNTQEVIDFLLVCCKEAYYDPVNGVIVGIHPDGRVVTVRDGDSVYEIA